MFESHRRNQVLLYVFCVFTYVEPTTQFSILVGMSALPRVFSGPMGACLQAYIGWAGLYQIAFIFTLGFIPFLILMRRSGVFSKMKV